MADSKYRELKEKHLELKLKMTAKKKTTEVERAVPESS